MDIVTRFPPSPTGFMHVGTARTALFNWLYAKHTGGKMVFRIEDTDRARHNEAAIEALINGLKWLGLDWDGDIVSQYERRGRHAEVAHELLKAGKAYYCYCTPDELDAMRQQAMKDGKAQMYDRRWRDSTASPPEGIKPSIRIKAPLAGERTVRDRVQGEVTVTADHLDDFIILRSDGVPTYMLAVVVDDHDMGVTHVIRGDDHLNNTFRQNVIIDAMEWPHPVYAHLPLILDATGAKMSKRKGAASIEEFRDMGYLPEALFNYLLKLGWGHGDDEIISRQQAIEWFDLDGVVKSPARWDMDKLNFINAHYIKEADNARLAGLAGAGFSPAGRARLQAGMDDLKNRAKTILQISDEGAFYDYALPFPYDDKAREALKGAEPVLRELAARLKALPSFDAVSIEAACKSVSSDLTGGKLGLVMMPLRAAITGKTVSPSLPHACAILGLTETIARIEQACSHTG